MASGEAAASKQITVTVNEETPVDLASLEPFMGDEDAFTLELRTIVPGRTYRIVVTPVDRSAAARTAWKLRTDLAEPLWRRQRMEGLVGVMATVMPERREGATDSNR